MFLAVNLSAQNSLTNTIPEFLINARAWENRSLLSHMSETFKARINAEVDIVSLLSGINEVYSSDGIKTKEQQEHDLHGRLKFIGAQEMAFTNATLEEIFCAFFENMPSHIWRYDCVKDIIYVQPATNAISMTRIASVSINNDTIFEFQKTLSQLGFDILPKFISHKINGNMRRFDEDKLSLEFEDAYLYEILDAVVAQIPDARGWIIMRKRIYFYGINEEKL